MLLVWYTSMHFLYFIFVLLGLTSAKLLTSLPTKTDPLRFSCSITSWRESLQKVWNHLFVPEFRVFIPLCISQGLIVASYTNLIVIAIRKVMEQDKLIY